MPDWRLGTAFLPSRPIHQIQIYSSHVHPEDLVMGDGETRMSAGRRPGPDRRSGVDQRSADEKRSVRERRSDMDRRAGFDRRSTAKVDASPIVDDRRKR
jgi:hypothetical protein